MSTKRLRRSVVEGGKRAANSWDHHYNLRRERRLSKVFCEQYTEDSEFVPARIYHHYREFADRLTPLYNWIMSHLGESWDDVYSKFCAENDRRTTKGWHLHGHLDGYVSQYGEYRHRWFSGLYVDENGTLRDKVRTSTRYPHSKKNSDLVKIVLSWQGDFLILPYGKEVMFYQPVYGSNWEHCYDSRAEHRMRPHRSRLVNPFSKLGEVTISCQAISGYRQAGPLTVEQLAYWNRLPGSVREYVAVQNYRRFATIKKSIQSFREFKLGLLEDMPTIHLQACHQPNKDNDDERSK